GLVLECCLKYGALNEVHISNMEEQNQEKRRLTEKPLGVVSVGLGEGIKAVLESMGVDVVVSGGQTMNPSTQELLDAIKQVNASQVLLLPNNKNILLAAKQAVEMSEKKVYLVPTVNVAQGMAAMLMFNPYEEAEHLAEDMAESASQVRYGEITKAARNTKFKGQEVSIGNYIGLADDELCCGGTDLEPVLAELLAELLDEDKSIVTLYYGAELKENEAQKLVENLAEKFAEVEFEVHYGGQPHYQCLLSVE
ncbi:MAG: DAK2 domain-containing protein, partial [Clostridia bacterium]|nr:DAK2 domain-containing protein [Clostridia bacterium]